MAGSTVKHGRLSVRALRMSVLSILAAGSVVAAHASEPGQPARARALTGQAGRALPRTSLPMTLVGVMVDSADPARSACLIRCTPATGRMHASFLQAGESACDQAVVEQIREDAVVLRNALTKELELLPLQADRVSAGERVVAEAPVPEPAIVEARTDSVSVEVPKAAVEHYLVNLSELMASAQATPRFGDNASGQRVIEGFELRQVKVGSVVEKVGLRDGDVIVEVNGEKLDGLPAAMRLLGQAQTMAQARVTVLRGGQRMTFVLNVK